MADTAKKQRRKAFIKKDDTEKDKVKKPRKKKRKQTFSIHLLRVLKELSPDKTISKKAMIILNCFINDMFEKLAAEAGRLSSSIRRKTITSREIQSAVKLILPGDLAKYAITEGTKACSSYMRSVCNELHQL